MTVLLFSIIAGLLIICVILLILLLKKGNKSKNFERYSTDYETRQLDIFSIKFPKKIDEMGHHLLFQACVKVFESFKALEYSKKSDHVLNNYEWHTWQISLLLSLIQRDQDFFIPNPKNLFHEVILSKSLKSIKNDFDTILVKYEENVNLNKSRDELCKELIWSAKEVSIIFYYMLNSKEFQNFNN